MSSKQNNWYEVVAHSDALAKRIVEIPDGQRYSVRGHIQDVMIVSVPSSDMHRMVEDGSFDKTMEALAVTVRGGGFDGGLLIVPDGLRFMKLEAVDRVTAKLLEQRDQRQRAEHAVQANKIKEKTDNDLTPDTKTVGEA